MFSIMSLIAFVLWCFDGNAMTLIGSGILAIAGAVDSFAYKYFKNK